MPNQKYCPLTRDDVEIICLQTRLSELRSTLHRLVSTCDNRDGPCNGDAHETVRELEYDRALKQAREVLND